MSTFAIFIKTVLITTFLSLTGKYFLFLKRVFRKPEKWTLFFRQFFVEADKLVISSIPLIALISVFIGAVLVIQTANNMGSPFIPKMYIGYMARESLVLEFCSTMVCLILAGKIGSNISSEIGTMRITEQIDAMEMMGVNSACLADYITGIRFAFNGFYVTYSIIKTAVFSFIICSVSSFYGSKWVRIRLKISMRALAATMAAVDERPTPSEPPVA